MVSSGHKRPLLILASASPRRLDLLEQIGVVPEVVEPVELDESPGRDEQPAALAGRLAIAKARAAISRRPAEQNGLGIIVMGADTVVACGRRIFPKAQDEAEARRTLTLLSGRRHRVYTGVAIEDTDGKSWHRVVKTTVALKRLDTRELNAYLLCDEWRGKAGAYGIQGQAAAFVRFINGSYSNVVGLPLFETAALLNSAGYPVPTGKCET